MRILNKILRIIIGLPFVTITYMFANAILGAALVLDLFIVWLEGGSFQVPLGRFRRSKPMSPYQFVKDVCKD